MAETNTNDAVDTSLTNAITAAVKSEDEKVNDANAAGKTDSPSGGEDKGGDKEGEKKEEGKTKEDGEVQGEDEDTVNGRILLKALKDPARAGAVIDYLATQAGYTRQTVKNQADVKEGREEIEAILERNLGEDFKFLVPKLAPAIRESMHGLLEQHNASIRERLDKQELKEIQKETAEAHVALAQEWFGSDQMPDKVVKAMSAAMDEFPPTDPKMTADRYYRRIFTLVVGELGLTKKNPTKEAKTERNRKDEPVRNLSSSNRGVTPNPEGNPRKLTLKDAVSLAMEQVEEASRK